ncbi:MAG: hypothetical protein K2X93_23285 [Candidatus Obscuribacterales bacterium]|nr:hypothetical protein [Candidatus Obscuribacterales bacterium]
MSLTKTGWKLVLTMVIVVGCLASSQTALAFPASGTSPKTGLSAFYNCQQNVNCSNGPCNKDGSPDKKNPCFYNVDKRAGGGMTPGKELAGCSNPVAFEGTSSVGCMRPDNFDSRCFTGPEVTANKIKQVFDANQNKFSDPVTGAYAAVSAEIASQSAANADRPLQNAMQGQAQAMGCATAAADVCGELGHTMADTAIEYVATSMHNFTIDDSNIWNRIRNEIFVPMGILLLLPGAVLSQTRAIMAASNPVLGQVNPFDGILRSLVGIFLIPGTYLVCNYGIDLANSITYTISSEYKRMHRSDMYKDALCHEIKAMPWRLPQENRNTIDIPVSSMGQILLGNKTPFAQLEAELIAVKIYDPCAKIYIVPEDRANEVVPASVMAARMAANSSNAALCTSWSILCALQMAYLYYLWCVGPVVAALWVWPMKHLRDALPSWVEGVITVCFWSFFWNTVVLLIACFRGVDETGTIMMLALNTLANLSVKFAFDFAGLVRGAAGEAMKLGDKIAKAVGDSAKDGGGGKDKKPSGPSDKPSDGGDNPIPPMTPDKKHLTMTPPPLAPMPRLKMTETMISPPISSANAVSSEAAPVKQEEKIDRRRNLFAYETGRGYHPNIAQQTNLRGLVARPKAFEVGPPPPARTDGGQGLASRYAEPMPWTENASVKDDATAWHKPTHDIAGSHAADSFNLSGSRPSLGESLATQFST